MRSLFEVTTPNTGGLLTTAEARAAVGISNGSSDADIDRLIARISASIFRACKLAQDGINPPTLLSEAITETFRLKCNTANPLRLSRRRVTGDLTVTEVGAELEDTSYEIDRAAGLLYRLGSGDYTCWSSGVIAVEYTAGFLTVPPDLTLAAETWFRTLWRDAYANPSNIDDPMVKVKDIPGVLRVERWVNPTTETILPPEVESILIAGGYIETWVA